MAKNSVKKKEKRLYMSHRISVESFFAPFFPMRMENSQCACQLIEAGVYFFKIAFSLLVPPHCMLYLGSNAALYRSESRNSIDQSSSRGVSIASMGTRKSRTGSISGNRRGGSTTYLNDEHGKP